MLDNSQVIRRNNYLAPSEGKLSSSDTILNSERVNFDNRSIMPDFVQFRKDRRNTANAIDRDEVLRIIKDNNTAFKRQEISHIATFKTLQQRHRAMED